MTGTRSERTTLITGASSGIGRELAIVAAEYGDDLVITAPEQEPLDELAGRLREEHGVDVLVIAEDLTRPGGVEALHEAVLEAGVEVDALVNNAGIPVYGDFTGTDTEKHRELIQLNIEALTALTHRFTRQMADRDGGYVLNLGSLAGEYPVPKASSYAASKSYIRSFSVALADELADTGVSVTVLCPRETDTKFLERGGLDQSSLTGSSADDPADVARAGYEAMLAGDTIAVPNNGTRLYYYLARILPYSLRARLARRHWE